MASTNNPLGTYYYSPDIKAYISSSSILDVNGKPKVLDISPDIMNFSISRQVNSTSTASLTLSNKGFKYTPARLDNPTGPYTAPTPIETMDRIVIYLKRDVWLQVFSGYITTAPILTLVPEPVMIQAHCTLYKIQNTFWDIGNPSFQALMPGLLMSSEANYQQFGDGGAAQGIVNVLTNVVGWNKSKIHITAIPAAFVAASVKTYTTETKSNLPQNTTDKFVRALDGAGIIASDNLINVGINGTGVGNYVTVKNLPASVPAASVAIPNGAYTYASLPTGTYAQAYSGQNEGIVVQNTDVNTVFDYYSATYPGGKKEMGALLQPVDKSHQDADYWCVISWPYYLHLMGNTVTDNASIQNSAAQWLSDDGYNGNSGRHLLITSIANAKQVVVKASMAGDTGNNIILSRAAWEYLAGSAVSYKVNNGDGTSRNADFYSTNLVAVTAAWAIPGKTIKGPQDNTSLVGQLNNYGFTLGKTLAESPGTAVIYNTVTGEQVTSSAPVLNQGAGNIGDRTPVSTIKDSNDWARLCLQLAGFPDNGWNVGFLANWITCEMGPKWAIRNNPLNSSDATLNSRFGKAKTPTAAWPTLYDAAANWAAKMGGSNTGYGAMWDQIGAIFDSKPRINIEATKKARLTNPKASPIYWPSANYGVSPTDLSKKTLATRYTLFAVAVMQSPWDGGRYAGKRTVLQSPNFAVYQRLDTGPVAEGADMLPGTNKGPGLNNGTPGSATTNSTLNTSGSTVIDSGVGTGNSFNTQFAPSQMDLETLALLGSPRAFITDQPVLSSISSLATSSLRHFQSSPTGDFIAWFPDYFGVYGQAPALNVFDIEIINFSLYHDDTQLTTHIAVSGDIINMGAEVGLVDWMSTNGIVSVQIDEVMAQLFGMSVEALNKMYPPSFSQNFLLRYGMRPLAQPMPIIRSHVTEFMYAWQLFMMKWADQYTVQVQFTYLPELYPGMRIRLADHKIEVYVTAVSHQGDRNGGFTTTASVTCPVYRNNPTDKPVPLHYGFPYSKVQKT